jgi:RND superfamily putative drug exporter
MPPREAPKRPSRMTLVPAVLALLGRRAWRLPGWTDRRLPTLDIEGEKLHQQLETPSPTAHERRSAAV